MYVLSLFHFDHLPKIVDGTMPLVDKRRVMGNITLQLTSNSRVALNYLDVFIDSFTFNLMLETFVLANTVSRPPTIPDS